MQLVSAVSRKTHGSAGTFDIELPQTGNPGIECRSGGITEDYTILLTFTNNVSVSGASVTSGIGSVNDFSVAGNEVTVNLTKVTNAQTIVLTLTRVYDGTNTSDVQVAMGVLIADVNASRHVDGTDTSLVRQQNFQSITLSNFREDIDASGHIDGTDISIVRQHNFDVLPSSP